MRSSLVELVGRGKAIAQNNEGAGDFSGFEVGFGDHATVAHSGMFEQDGFDFGRRNRKSFVLDHFLAAVEHIVKTFGIGADDIAGVIPAIAKNRGCGLRFFPISQHNLRAAHNKFAGFAGCDVVVIGVEDAAPGER